MINKRILVEKYKVARNEFIELYRDDDFVLVIPLTHEASKKYGSEAQWCTTKKECDKEFQDHIKIGVLGYIVIRNNDLKKRLENNAFALYRLHNDSAGRTIVFDDRNIEYRNGEQWLSNKFDRVDKLFQFYKMMSNFNNHFDQVQKEKKPINEEYKYEINEVEPILKLVLMQKYDWLKDLKLKNLRVLEFGMIFINGLMIVDEEWGAKKWREQYMETSFPGNLGWENGDYYDIVALSNILGKEESEEIKNEIKDVVKYVTGKEISSEGNMSFALKFV